MRSFSAVGEQAVVGALREFLRELLGRDVDVSPDTPLIEEGYLTSLQAVEVVAFIEETFGVEIEPEDVDEENFHSLRTIARLVISAREGVR